MTANRESGYVTILVAAALAGGLLVAAVAGLAGNDPGQREEESSPAVPPISSVSQPSLFLLGDGIDPTVPGLASIAGSGVGGDWQDLFNADGTLRDDYDENGVLVPGGNGTPDAIDRFGGRAAYFIADDVSADANIDRTILGDSADRWTSGRVSASQDLGNAYVFVTSDASGNAVLYLGLERLTARGASRIEAEFSEQPARLDETSGEIVRERTDGDLLIRISYDRDGALATVEILSWTSSEKGISEYVAVAQLEGEGCIAGETLCAFSNADTIEGGAWPSFDASGAPVSKLAPGTFTELGVNLGSVAPPDTESSNGTGYSGIQLATGDDVVVKVLDASGNADVITDIGCMQDEAGFGLQCTANDVSIASVTNIVILDDGCAFLGDTVTFTADFQLLLTAQARHDVGMWFSTDGDPNADGAISGTCTAATPAYAPDPPWLDLDGTSDDPGGVIQDTCGDIDNDHNPLFPNVTLTATCIDPDGDGKLDLPNCTSWRQPGANDLCTSPQQAFPGAPSKCKCDPGFDIDIEVPVICENVPAGECCNPVTDERTPIDDGIDCTVDVCDEATGEVSHTPNHGFCDDGNVCTSDSCDPDADPGTDGCVSVPVTDGSQPQCEEGVCIPALCDTDDNPCTEGACNPDGTCADPVTAADSTPCEDGLYCTSETGEPGTPDHCEAGVCVGIDVDCGDGDQCNDDVCDEAADACIVVPKAESSPCEDGNFCTSLTGVPGTPDHCDGAGACVGNPVNCGDGDQCNDDVCDEAADACIVVPKAESSPCEDGNFCTSLTGVPGTPDHCDGAGACVGNPVNCGDGDQCNDDVCDEAADACIVVPKAESSPCEDGNFCTSLTGVPGTPDHCDGAGACVGNPVNCGDGDQCNDDVCDEAADACIVVPKAESSPCEDGNFCTSLTGVPGTPDHCDGAGACVGNPVNCGDGDQCNDDVCDEAADACIVVPKAESSPCEDGNFCTSLTGVPGTPDHCDGAGACVGNPVNCGDGDQCNDDVCDEAADACIVVPKAESSPCEDGNFCTSLTGVPGTPDHCDGAGACVGNPVNCGDGDQCNDDVCDEAADACIVVPKAESSPCEDGNFCTSLTGVPGTPDHCDGAGACVGNPVNCGDGDQCNDDVCDEAADACIVVPKAESSPCEDGNFCTSLTGVPGTPDHCDGAGACVGNPVNCGDGDQCNDDVCDEAADACIVVPKAESSPCEDGNFCTSLTGVPGTPDHCDGAGACVGNPVNCGDGDQCNDDVCDEAADACIVVPKAESSPCEDGNFCTSLTGVPGTPDHCDGAGACVGNPVNCGDGDQCNDDVCDEAADACIVVPKAESSPCEDGNFCTSLTGVPGTPDHCDGAGACVGNPVNCGDGDQCNDDVCDEAADACIVVPKADSTPCEDGNACTSETGAEASPDHCEAGVCVGVPVICGPGDQCNNDVCNPATGTCAFVPKPDSTPCEDGDVCTSETGTAQTPDHCEAGMCVGVQVDCSAFDDQCNIGTCDAATGACFADPYREGETCDDDNPDTSGDVCYDGVCLGCDPQPRTQGFWHRQCLGLSLGDGGIDPGRNGHGPSQPNFPGFLELRNECSDPIIGDLFLPDPSPWGSPTCRALDATPPSDQCEKANKQLAALILNQCSGNLSPTCALIAGSLPGGCGGPEVTTVSELIDWAIANLNGTYMGEYPGTCNEVAQCAAAVNEGPGVGAPDEAEYDNLIFNETITKESGTTSDQQIGDRSETLSLGRSAGGRR